MKDIKCPSCGKTFRIDPSSFEEILLQIKDEEFNKQIKERLTLAEEDNKKALEILKRELKIQLIEQNRIKESEIQTLESKLKIADEKKTNALNDLKNQATNKINSLNNELVKLKDEIKTQSMISELSLKNKVSEAVNNLEKENSSLTNCIEKMKLEHSINEKLIEEKFKSKISERDLTIQELREMKSRLSTKMVGETLEIHCETQFNLNRASAFKNSYFEKDNDASTGSKGDYIFREFDDNKTEVVSIMFEMKNESLNGTNKRKNEDFLKELDKDRRQKSCEYAVLVSLLEPDSELYNAGIVDVSYRFPKMYVIRPQFFLPIISLLRNASMETLKYKSQIDLMRRENYDITNFESTLEQFKNAVGKNVSLAQDRFNDAISEIDKSITHLQKTKEALILSKKHLLSADSKSQDLTVKKLTRNNPTMKKKFNDLNNFEDEVA
ncbi:hypothetical protein EU99_0333 [Prochlorococcus marinus str. MIT 9321]|uniref:DUF2130 domain-containing protein n=1 Tax=Prochlorococcus marinus str. MIT 9401 TaxID=167551 RepID=A0A0A2B055_PROMR|nr:DUF2130 domain-containing protein [Prochlorococcus marinus]KGG04539.1 hypothetical protein EV00_1571 [Prochlorococcus marinus str. MIT 9322]KGG05006.1 hypothetical protein EU99_0333 [Prochlorococcus marinus str. MIT 9321]KGG07221.1 hypothetical protein EV01_1558 [Prochlorococcus marinus str. MIT 9401]